MRLIILLSAILISVNCFSDPVSIAEDYLDLQWVVDSVNVYSHYVTSGNPHEGYTTTYPCDWVDSIGVTITGMPYHYGGKDSFTQWDNDYTNGTRGPGAHYDHYSSNPPSSLWWAAGIDCSGMVGRCWGVPEASMDSCGCSYLVTNSHNITGQQVQPGDAFISTVNEHCRLCYYRDETDPDDDRVQTIEATGDSNYNKTIEHEYSIQQMIGINNYPAQSLNEVTNIAGGNVSGTWTLDNCPYMINGEITIPQGSQLIIEPGVNVIITGHYKFNINGRLLAEGEEHKYIFFTAQNQTTGWNGLRFIDQNTNGQDSSKVVYCKLQYGNASASYPDNNGGAIYLDNSDILIDNCIISDNSANGGGGGLFVYNSSSPTITHTIIRDNISNDAGGGIHIYDSCTPILENVCINNNEAVSTVFGRGGGIYCDSFCYPALTNVTISNNTANHTSPNPGGAIYSCNYSFPDLINCILWDDLPQEIGDDGFGSVAATYSDVEGGTPGDGNINTDPLFADPANDNYQITWSNYPVDDATKSPCIDTGSLYLPLDPDDTVSDMGAYYFQQDAVVSPPVPLDVMISINTDSVYITWSATRNRNTYKVYSSSNPYDGFEEDLSGTFDGNSWTAPFPSGDDKKFYYVTSSDEREQRIINKKTK